jgi:hypothetical protein
MKQVIVLLEKGTEFSENISNVSFASMVTEVNGKISLEEFGGSDGPGLFKKSSIFSYFPNYDFSSKSKWTEEDVQLSQISPVPLASLLTNPHNTHLLPTALHWLASNLH